MAVSVEALVFIIIGRRCLKGCEFDSHYRQGSFLRFNSPRITSSPYSATWNKGVWLLLVLKLWPIVQTSVMSENDGITVRQTVAHTVQLGPHGYVRHVVHAFEEKGTIIRSVSKPRSRINGAGPYDTITTGPRWGVYNTCRRLNKYTSYILTYISEKIKFLIFDLEKVGQDHGGEKRYLQRLIANVRMCIAEFFVIILASDNIWKRTNFTYFKHLKSKM